ncbi:GspH/FimT family pseudopilin [Dyella japonica]|uniref:Type II secretion system protein H n=1 Tax=Dyella japonica TaxID=231455 RepID=A0ABV2K425_9GAMM
MNGFTLIEMMVTLSVIVILTLVAIPSFHTFLQNVRRDSIVDGLVTSLHYARNQALSFNQPTSLCAGTSGTGCTDGSWVDGWQVVTIPAGASTVTLASHALVPTMSVPNLRTVKGSTSLQFTGQGLVKNMTTAGYELIVVCDARGATGARAVLVNRMGYIQASPKSGIAPNGDALTCPT